MAKWYNDKTNEEIIKKIEEIKLDVSAYAKDSIDTSLFAIDKAQNDRLASITEMIGSLNDSILKYSSKTDDSLNDLLSKVEKNKDYVDSCISQTKESIDTSLSVMDKAQSMRLDQINESIEHLSNDYFTNKNKTNFKLVDIDNNYKDCTAETIYINKEIAEIKIDMTKLKSKNDVLYLLVGLVGFAVFGYILWTLINL